MEKSELQAVDDSYPWLLRRGLIPPKIMGSCLATILLAAELAKRLDANTDAANGAPLLVRLLFGTPGRLRDMQRPTRLRVGGVLFLLGASLAVAGRLAFARVGNKIMTGQKQGRLMTSGVFALNRNPMYSGFVLGLAAVAVTPPVLLRAGAGDGGWLGTGARGVGVGAPTWLGLLMPAAFWAAIDRCFVPWEEATMRRNFGEGFAAYCRAVSRWLPRFPSPV